MLEKLIEALSASGTGRGKLEIVRDRLQKLPRGATPDMAADRLKGSGLPEATIAKVVNIFEHGVPDPVEVAKVDPSQFANRSELVGFRAALKEAAERLAAQDAKIEELSGKAAHEREERAKIEARLAAIEEALTSGLSEKPQGGGEDPQSGGKAENESKAKAGK